MQVKDFSNTDAIIVIVFCGLLVLFGIALAQFHAQEEIVCAYQTGFMDLWQVKSVSVSSIFMPLCADSTYKILNETRKEVYKENVPGCNV
jgi:hypothetical protein